MEVVMQGVGRGQEIDCEKSQRILYLLGLDDCCILKGSFRYLLYIYILYFQVSALGYFSQRRLVYIWAEINVLKHWETLRLWDSVIHASTYFYLLLLTLGIMCFSVVLVQSATEQRRNHNSSVCLCLFFHLSIYISLTRPDEIYEKRVTLWNNRSIPTRMISVNLSFFIHSLLNSLEGGQRV